MNTRGFNLVEKDLEEFCIWRGGEIDFDLRLVVVQFLELMNFCPSDAYIEGKSVILIKLEKDILIRRENS